MHLAPGLDLIRQILQLILPNPLIIHLRRILRSEESQQLANIPGPIGHVA